MDYAAWMTLAVALVLVGCIILTQLDRRYMVPFFWGCLPARWLSWGVGSLALLALVLVQRLWYWSFWLEHWHWVLIGLGVLYVINRLVFWLYRSLATTSQVNS